MERRSFPYDFDKSAEARSAKAVAEQLIATGHQAVLAGGAVRDLLLGREPKDFDIATDAHPQTVLKAFSNTRRVGIAFGVVLVRDFEATVEVATFRADLDYQDGRHPEGVVFSDAPTDAQRRDFSVNGLFYDLATQEIIDHVGGLEDLEQKKLRAIGEPEQRFREDYLRLLRAVRFAISLDFDIENETWDAIKRCAPSIRHIAVDRVHEELRRSFAQGRSDRALELLLGSGLWQELLPLSVASTSKAALEEKPRWSARALGESPPHDEAGAADLATVIGLSHQHLSHNQLDKLCTDLRCTNGEKKEALSLSRTLAQLPHYDQLDTVARKRLLRQHSAPQLRFALRHSLPCLDQQRHILADLGRWSEAELWPGFLPRGKDLIAMGVNPGPELGHWLKRLDNLALNGAITNQKEAENALQQGLEKDS